MTSVATAAAWGAQGLRRMEVAEPPGPLHRAPHGLVDLGTDRLGDRGNGSRLLPRCGGSKSENPRKTGAGVADQERHGRGIAGAERYRSSYPRSRCPRSRYSARFPSEDVRPAAWSSAEIPSGTSSARISIRVPASSVESSHVMVIVPE